MKDMLSNIISLTEMVNLYGSIHPEEQEELTLKPPYFKESRTISQEKLNYDYSSCLIE